MTIATEALAALHAAGFREASIWKMGGNIEAAGMNLAVRGLHLCVAEAWADDAVAVAVVGWDAPATENLAERVLRGAGAFKVEDAGDDTLAFAGSLEGVIEVARAVPKVAAAIEKDNHAFWGAWRVMRGQGTPHWFAPSPFPEDRPGEEKSACGRYAKAERLEEPRTGDVRCRACNR